MRTTAQVLGDAAETCVAERLSTVGWTVLGRNLRIGRAEIDLLCVEPGRPPNLVVVEVRWRRRRDYGLPEETVGALKIRRLRQAAWSLRDRGRLGDGTPVPALPIRIDIVAVEPAPPGDPPRIRHHRAVG